MGFSHEVSHGGFHRGVSRGFFTGDLEPEIAPALCCAISLFLTLRMRHEALMSSTQGSGLREQGLVFVACAACGEMAYRHRAASFFPIAKNYTTQTQANMQKR